MTALHLRCPAKLNLILHVRGRRPDGYHELLTVFHAVALWDDLWAVPAPAGVHLTVRMVGPGRDGFAVPADASNLVVRAAAAFHAAFGITTGVRFHLDKRIPAGGGLGGGSADAAGALRLLAHRHGVAVDDPRLQACAAGLGSDVPFFLAAPTAVGRGRGELLEPVAPAPALWFVLLLPPWGTSTPEIYRHWRPQALTQAPRPLSLALDNIRSGNALQVRAELHNDLETPARALLPELDRLFQTVAEAGHSGLRLSGSGSTCFLAFTDDYAAGEAAHQLTRILARDRVEVLRVRSVALDEWAVIRDDAGYPGLLPGADAP